MPQVVGMGAMNMDYFYRVESILGEGEAAVEEFRASPGGSAANTIYALARLGVSTGFIGAVGGDGEGQALIDDLARAGVDVGQVRRKPQAPTGRILALVDRQGRRALYALPGANGLLSPEDIDLDYVRQAQLLHLSAFVGEAQRGAQVWLAGRLAPGAKLSFAPGALYFRLGLSPLLPLLGRTDLLFLNRREIEELTGAPLPRAARRLLEIGCRQVVVTLGGEEAVCAVYEGDKEYRIQPRLRPDRVVDSTGAGDAFAAGYLFGLLQGEDAEGCARLGEIIAVDCLQELGARPGLPDRARLLAQRQALRD